MLTQHATVKSISDAPTLSPHKQQPASRTPHPQSTTSNATRTQPHTATAETRHRSGGMAAMPTTPEYTQLSFAQRLTEHARTA